MTVLLYAKDYGAVPNTGEPQGAAVRAAITTAVSSGPGACLVFDRGTYLIDPPDAASQPAYNQNPQFGGHAFYHIYITNALGLTLQGTGTVFKFTDPLAGGLRAANCESFDLEGITFDYAGEPWAYGTVRSADAAGDYHSSFVFSVSEGGLLDTDAQTSGGAYNPDDSAQYALCIAENNMGVASYSKNADGTYTLQANYVPDPGDTLTIYRPNVQSAAIDVSGCNNVWINGCAVNASPGHGILGAYGGEGMTVENTTVGPAAGAASKYSIFGDGLRCVGLDGALNVTGCGFKGIIGDGIDMYQEPMQVQSVNADGGVVLTNPYATPLQGDVLRFIGQSGAPLGSATVTEVTPLPKANGDFRCTVTLDAPPDIGDGAIAFDDSYAFQGSAIKNCAFDNISGGGIEIAAKGAAIDSCEFANTVWSAVWVGNRTGSCFASDVTITNSTFDGGNTYYYAGAVMVNPQGGPDSTAHLISNVIIQGNTIKNYVLYAIYAYNADGLQIIGNTFSVTEGDASYCAGGEVSAYNCNAVKVSGNNITDTRAGLKYSIYLSGCAGTVPGTNVFALTPGAEETGKG